MILIFFFMGGPRTCQEIVEVQPFDIIGKGTKIGLFRQMIRNFLRRDGMLQKENE